MTAPADIAARLVARMERASGAAGERAAAAVHHPPDLALAFGADYM